MFLKPWLFLSCFILIKRACWGDPIDREQDILDRNLKVLRTDFNKLIENVEDFAGDFLKQIHIAGKLVETAALASSADYAWEEDKSSTSTLQPFTEKNEPSSPTSTRKTYKEAKNQWYKTYYSKQKPLPEMFLEEDISNKIQKREKRSLEHPISDNRAGNGQSAPSLLIQSGQREIEPLPNHIDDGQTKIMLGEKQSAPAANQIHDGLTEMMHGQRQTAPSADHVDESQTDYIMHGQRQTAQEAKSKFENGQFARMPERQYFEPMEDRENILGKSHTIEAPILKNGKKNTALSESSCSTKTQKEIEMEKEKLEQLKREVTKLNDLVDLLKNQQNFLNSMGEDYGDINNDYNENNIIKTLAKQLKNKRKQKIAAAQKEVLSDEVGKRDEIPAISADIQELRDNLKETTKHLNETKDMLLREQETEEKLKIELKRQNKELHFLKIMMENLYYKGDSLFPEKSKTSKKDDSLRNSNSEEQDTESLLGAIHTPTPLSFLRSTPVHTPEPWPMLQSTPNTLTTLIAQQASHDKKPSNIQASVTNNQYYKARDAQDSGNLTTAKEIQDFFKKVHDAYIHNRFKLENEEYEREFLANVTKNALIQMTKDDPHIHHGQSDSPIPSQVHSSLIDFEPAETNSPRKMQMEGQANEDADKPPQLSKEQIDFFNRMVYETYMKRLNNTPAVTRPNQSPNKEAYKKVYLAHLIQAILKMTNKSEADITPTRSFNMGRESNPADNQDNSMHRLASLLNKEEDQHQDTPSQNGAHMGNAKFNFNSNANGTPADRASKGEDVDLRLKLVELLANNKGREDDAQDKEKQLQKAIAKLLEPEKKSEDEVILDEIASMLKQKPQESKQESLAKLLKNLDANAQSKTDEPDVENELRQLQVAIDNLRPKIDVGVTNSFDLNKKQDDTQDFQALLNQLVSQNEAVPSTASSIGPAEQLLSPGGASLQVNTPNYNKMLALQTLMKKYALNENAHSSASSISNVYGSGSIIPPNSNQFAPNLNSYGSSLSPYGLASSEYGANAFGASSNQYLPNSNAYGLNPNAYVTKSNGYGPNPNLYEPSSNAYGPNSNLYSVLSGLNSNVYSAAAVPNKVGYENSGQGIYGSSLNVGPYVGPFSSSYSPSYGVASNSYGADVTLANKMGYSPAGSLLYGPGGALGLGNSYQTIQGTKPVSQQPYGAYSSSSQQISPALYQQGSIYQSGSFSTSPTKIGYSSISPGKTGYGGILPTNYGSSDGNGYAAAAAPANIYQKNKGSGIDYGNNGLFPGGAYQGYHLGTKSYAGSGLDESYDNGPYSNQHKVNLISDLNQQINSLENVINGMQKGGNYYQPDDHTKIAGLEQRIRELKGIINDLNRPSPSYYKQPQPATNNNQNYVTQPSTASNQVTYGANAPQTQPSQAPQPANYKAATSQQPAYSPQQPPNPTPYQSPAPLSPSQPNQAPNNAAPVPYQPVPQEASPLDNSLSGQPGSGGGTPYQAKEATGDSNFERFAHMIMDLDKSEMKGRMSRSKRQAAGGSIPFLPFNVGNVGEQTSQLEPMDTKREGVPDAGVSLTQVENGATHPGYELGNDALTQMANIFKQYLDENLTAMSSNQQTRNAAMDGLQQKLDALKTQLGSQTLLARLYPDYTRQYYQYNYPPPPAIPQLTHVPYYAEQKPSIPVVFGKELEKSKRRQIDVVGDIVLKILDKIWEKLPEILGRVFGNLLGDLGDRGYVDKGSYGTYGSLKTVLGSLGHASFLPLIIIRIVEAADLIFRHLMKNRFFTNFLLPGVAIAVAAIGVMFILYFFQPNEPYGYIGYQGNSYYPQYEHSSYDNDYRPGTNSHYYGNKNYYRYNGEPEFDGNFNGKPFPLKYNNVANMANNNNNFMENNNGDMQYYRGYSDFKDN